MVPTPVIHAIIWITTHLLTPEWWKAELLFLADPFTAGSFATEWSPANNRSSAGQKPKSQPQSYVANVGSRSVGMSEVSVDDPFSAPTS